MAKQSTIYAQEEIRTEDKTYKPGDEITKLDGVTLQQLVSLATTGKVADHKPADSAPVPAATPVTAAGKKVGESADASPAK